MTDLSLLPDEPEAELPLHRQVMVLDAEILVAMRGLTLIQRRFIQNIPDAGSLQDAAVKAGYTKGSAAVLASNIRNGKADKLLVPAELVMRQYALRFGVPLSAKRIWLMDLIAITKDKRGEHFNPGQAIKAIELLSKLDKDLEPELALGGGTIILNIDTGIGIPQPSGNQRPAIEHDGGTITIDTGTTGKST